MEEFTVTTFIRFVVPGMPEGAPARTIILSPLFTKPFILATLIDSSIILSVESAGVVSRGTTPQMRFSLLKTLSSWVTAYMGTGGLYFATAIAVAPVLVTSSPD